MVEKDVTKKWLMLLIVLVALSLVVDLLSLNVLYGIGKGSILSTSGELASSLQRDCFNACTDGAQHDCVNICEQGTSTECSCCGWIVEESCRTSCGKSERKLSKKCR